MYSPSASSFAPDDTPDVVRCYDDDILYLNYFNWGGWDEYQNPIGGDHHAYFDKGSQSGFVHPGCSGKTVANLISDGMNY